MRLLKKSFFLLSTILVVSCQPYHPLSEHNFYNQSRLYNKPLELQVQFFGDIELKPLNESKSKEVKQKIKAFEKVKVRDLLAIGSTNVNPEYEVYLFIKKNNSEKAQEKGVLIDQDSTSKSVLFQKVGSGQTAYLFLEAQKFNENLQSLLKDGESIINSLSIGSEVEEKLSYDKVFSAVRDSPNYLKAIDKLAKAPIEKTDANEWMQFQYLATINSFFTNNPNYTGLIKEFEAKRKMELSPVLDTLLQKSEVKVDDHVLDHIKELAKDTRVVMLNENHWYPKHRIFALQLLEKLKDSGYTHLALEALSANQDKKINQRGYPTFNSGYYIREPYFGHLIRKAKELGFVLVSYENRNQEINRELGQAQNLQQALEQNQDHKIFVYAGLDHIIEAETKSGKRMAGYFKDLTGIDPLTINQSDLVGSTSNPLNLIPYHLLKNYKGLDKAVDFYVINNLETSIQNALSEDLDLKHLRIDFKRLENIKTDKIMVKIYKKTEYDTYKDSSVPIKARLTKMSERPLEYFLPHGNYIIHLSSINNDKILSYEISI